MTSPDFQIVVRSTRSSPLPVLGPGSPNRCSCCGLPSLRAPIAWQGRKDILVCEVCDLLQDITRPSIEQEAVIIWLPEMTQRQVMALVARAHTLIFGATQISAERARAAWWGQIITGLAVDQPPPLLPEGSAAAAHLVRTLHARSAEAFRRLQSTSPGHIATAMMMADTTRAEVRESLDALLGSLRLLPLGRLYTGANDIYPELLRSRLDADRSRH